MIYFDNAATTKPSLTAIARAKRFNNENFFNPSTLYRGGLDNAKEIRLAKEVILKSIGAIPNAFDMVFTSCGTESDNTAIFCAVSRGTFVTDLGEHAAVYKSFLHLKNKGQTVEFVKLNKDGSVNTDNLFETVKRLNADFVSVVHVNNETGAINDVNYIASELKKIKSKLIFHVDGVQAFGKIPFIISKDIDLYAISSHKINGLKGTGALIKRKNLNISPLIIGGGQESGLRSGTENIFGIKVFQYATEERYKSIKERFSIINEIKNYIAENLDKDIFVKISGENSSPYILTVSAVGLRGEIIMHSLEPYDIIIGNGSACSSKNRFSRVIEACGYNNEILDGVIRISFSPENTMEEAKTFVLRINEIAKRLKGIM